MWHTALGDIIPKHTVTNKNYTELKDVKYLPLFDKMAENIHCRIQTHTEDI